MTRDQREETRSESQMDSLRCLACNVRRCKSQGPLLVDATQGDDAGHHGKRDNHEEGKHHQTAQWIVSPISRAAACDKPGEVGVDRVELNGKAGKPRIGRPYKAPQNAKGDETCNRAACRDVNIRQLGGPKGR